MKEDLILGGLNAEQREAVETTEGPVLILAGAGSGKTRALTHRIAYLIDRGVPPWQILAVTFTNKAAHEMKERIMSLLKLTDGSGKVPAELPMVGTFHSVCVRMLRRDIEKIGRERSFVIYDADDQQKVMKEVLRELHIAEEDLKPKAAMGHIGRFKCEAMAPRDVAAQASTHFTEQIANAYKLYQEKLRDANAMDFDDLILETIRMLREVPEVLARYQNTWKFLHVDEYQDTNHAQYLLVSLLAGKHRNICVIGDPDQSIYAFRGADIRNILEFRNEYKNAKSIKLEHNYRSTQVVLDAADAVISANPRRPQKKMWTERKEGPRLTLFETRDEKAEAEEAMRRVLHLRSEGVPLDEQVILYRTNAQSRLFEEACLRHGIPYRIVGGVKFYARREVKDVLAYLLTILNPNDTVSLLRILNVPSRKIGKTTLAKLQNHANERQINLWQTLLHIEMVEGIPDAMKKRLASFTEMILSFQKDAETMPVSELAAGVLLRTGMEAWVKDGTDEGESRWQNILELKSVTRKYDALEPKTSLERFLEEVALVSEVDALIKEEERTEALTLMTVHLCKGLEFSSVVIGGCEENLFPHGSALLDRDQMEEERRLMYVAMTRAKTHLMLLHAQSRMLWGNTQHNHRSRFLDDIPHTLLEAKSDDRWSANAWHPGGGRRTAEWTEGEKEDEWGFNQDIPELEEGARVSHPHFGTGTFLSQEGDIAEILFDSGQRKKLALNIAPLTLLGKE